MVTMTDAFSSRLNQTQRLRPAPQNGVGAERNFLQCPNAIYPLTGNDVHETTTGFKGEMGVLVEASGDQSGQGPCSTESQRPNFAACDSKHTLRIRPRSLLISSITEQKLDGLVSCSTTSSKSDMHCFGARVDVSHESYLAELFRRVVLVDTDRVKNFGEQFVSVLCIYKNEL